MTALRRVKAGVLVAVATALAASTLGHAASAGAVTEFSGEATAAGLTVTATSQEDPTGTTFEAAGPVGTASVSSLPDSEAFAADPYPGNDLLNLTNIASQLVPVPVPAYPAQVHSGSPGKSKETLSTPGYELLASSTPTMSTGSGKSGLVSDPANFASVKAESTVTALGGGEVDAVGTTAADGIAVGPLTISSFDSRAEAKLDSAGTVAKRSSISTGGVAINGAQVGLTDKGLTVAGTQVPLPSAGPAAGALQQAGIAVTYLAAERSSNGIEAPGIAISVHQKDPTGKAATVTYTLGRAEASATPSDGPVSSGEGGGPANVDGSPLSAAARIAGVGSSPSGSSNPAGLATAPTSGTMPSIAPSSAPSSSVADSSGRSLAAVPGTTSGGVFYLLLIIAAVATLGVGQLMRFVGVRWARSSG